MSLSKKGDFASAKVMFWFFQTYNHGASSTETPEMHQGRYIYIYIYKMSFKGSQRNRQGYFLVASVESFWSQFWKTVLLIWQAMHLIAEEGSEFEANLAQKSKQGKSKNTIHNFKKLRASEITITFKRAEAKWWCFFCASVLFGVEWCNQTFMVPNLWGVCALVSLWYVVYLDITTRFVRDVEESSPPMKLQEVITYNLNIVYHRWS